MKTKLGLALLLCCCLMVVFNACQKEAIEPTVVEVTKKTTTEKEIFTADLMNMLPDNVFIEPIADGASDTKTSAWGRPFPVDIPVDCRTTYCFQLADTYQELQRVANFTCSPIQRRICCCFRGYYRCFLLGVYPNEICKDTSDQVPDIVIIDERVPVIRESK